VIGTGANDPQKMDPKASRETLDHSIMYIFAVALEDGGWHHEKELCARARQPSGHRGAVAQDLDHRGPGMDAPLSLAGSEGKGLRRPRGGDAEERQGDRG
jgi:hypothetical protein